MRCKLKGLYGRIVYILHVPNDSVEEDQGVAKAKSWEDAQLVQNSFIHTCVVLLGLCEKVT